MSCVICKVAASQESVPDNTSTTANLAFLSVEQNLADMVALIKHVKKSLGLTGAPRIQTLI